jgi:hypothetical protein
MFFAHTYTTHTHTHAHTHTYTLKHMCTQAEAAATGFLARAPAS